MMTKAVRIHGKMDLRLEEIELPEVGDDDVRVKIISDSICMSTYKAAVEGADHKRVPNDVAEHPTIVGHEFCGVIDAVGKTGSTSTSPVRLRHPAGALLQGLAARPGLFLSVLRRRFPVCAGADRDAFDRQPAHLRFGTPISTAPCPSR